MLKIIITTFVILAAMLSCALPAAAASGPIFTIYNYQYTVDWKGDSANVTAANVQLNPGFTTWPCGEGTNVCSITRYFSVSPTGFGHQYIMPSYTLTMYPTANNKNELLQQIKNFINKTGMFYGAIKSEYEAGACFVITVNAKYAYYIPSDCLYNIKEHGIKPTNPKPPAISCYLSNGLIDYGTVASGDLAGRKSSTQIRVFCTGAADVKLVSNQYNSREGVALGNGRMIFSHVSIDGYSADRGVTLRSITDSTVTIASELRVNNGVVPSGKYSGSLILTATIL